MGGELLPYVLPLVAVLVVGTAAAVALRTVTGTLRLLVAVPLGRAGSKDEEAAPAVLRRCDACGRGWSARGRLQPTLLGLYVRRLVRRRATDRDALAPTWSRAQGWHRCPSCFSRQVRTSGEPRTRRPRRSRRATLRAWGGLAALLGLLLLVVAVLSLLQEGGVA